MASTMIHLAVANELNKKLQRDRAPFLLGAISADISKLVGETKIKSHFLENIYNQVPRLELFLEKYKDKLDDDFVLGYYVHLYTDYLWFKYFMSEISTFNFIKTLDGETIRCNAIEFCKYIYNDYTNLNIQIIDGYDLDLKIFYNEIPPIEPIIDEIPMDKLNILRDQMGLIIERVGTKKDYIFEMSHIEQFIKTCIELTEANLKDLNIMK